MAGEGYSRRRALTFLIQSKKNSERSGTKRHTINLPSGFLQSAGPGPFAAVQILARILSLRDSRGSEWLPGAGVSVAALQHVWVAGTKVKIDPP